MSTSTRLTSGLLAVFVLSGFAGLLYQSVWTQYLGLTLGHAAYAQTLVLAIFMGGMAVGAWLASRYSVRWKRLVLGYAVVELVIGVFGLAFHPLFAAYTGFSQDVALPAMDGVAMARSYQWLTAALLIAPQSILLGATFPLMSAGLIRALPGQQGEVLGGLYFTNSLGAALGALLSTFVLLPAVGLPGTVLTAGILNIVVALLAWMLARSLHEHTLPPLRDAGDPGERAGDRTDDDEVRRLGRVMVWATAVSGAASFVYEVGWVRLLNQALGTTIHSFELMLAAFILGLAFGGLWIRKRARDIADPIRYVGHVQVWMAAAALLSIPVFTQSFGWVGWILSALSRSEGGYVLFELATAGIALLVMFPAAFLAGMTLPLFTLALMRAGAGERAIGRIYAANTLGAIVGVAATMHVLIPLMGVRLAVTAGALLDGLVGLYLLRAFPKDVPADMPEPSPLRSWALPGLVLASTVALSLVLGTPDPREQVAGVFRTGITETDGEVTYLRDGKTATVGVVKLPGGATLISTNGKPDAALMPAGEPAGPDEITMVMAGMLPLALHPDPREIAVIGWGSGLSTHTLMGSAVPARVDTIEIERAMVDGARMFGPSVVRAYTDPRSQLHVDDARTFFSTGARKYDAIVSEPSNPWVSGVASLFTREFYAFLRRHLRDDGLLVQWLHAYEIDDALVGTMLAALLAEFPHADLYVTNSADFLIVARTADGPIAPASAPPVGAALAAELQRVGLDQPAHYTLRHVASEASLRNFVAMLGATPHSDYFPVVSLTAPKTRFMQAEGRFLLDMSMTGLPVLDILDCNVPVGVSAGIGPIQSSIFSETRERALAAAEVASTGGASTALRDVDNRLDAAIRNADADGRRLAADPAALPAWSANVGALALATIGYLPAEDLVEVWERPGWLSPEVAAQPAVADLLAAYAAAARRDPVDMRSAAEKVLASPQDALSSSVREHMLVIAMLGAIAQGDRAAVESLQARWVPTTDGRMQATRGWITAWARRGAPVCPSLAVAGSADDATAGGGG